MSHGGQGWGGDPGSGRLGGESYNNKTKKENTSVTWGGDPGDGRLGGSYNNKPTDEQMKHVWHCHKAIKH